MTVLFTDTVLNMMTTTAEPEDYTGVRTVCFTAASAARRRKATFPRKLPHGWGMTSTQNVTANGKKRLEVNPPRNADETSHNRYGTETPGLHLDLTMQEWTLRTHMLNRKCPQAPSKHIYM